MIITSKKGSLDNVIIYKHVCDTIEDMDKIDPHYINLGSVAIVVKGQNGPETYIATSDKEWHKWY